ncbi:TPA: hypothetical protein DCW61_01550 [Candidatus Uhrbacteria bacterium]|nr:hypothetical protein [Candidatus Uhrbacteria bacterium]
MVKATITKGSSSYSVTSSSTTAGTVSSQFSGIVGDWSLSVRNGGSSATTGDVVVVVMSYSRFKSDWETARRGDIMQMYGDFGSNKCDDSGLTPHTTFVQVDYNTSQNCSNTSSCSQDSSSAGCNWLDANWVTCSNMKSVGVHNMSMDSMLKSMAYSPSYGFTVYQIN